jgi:hypothetical protein
MSFTNRWMRKNEQVDRVSLYRMYFSEEMKIGLRQEDENFDWEVKNASTQNFFNRIVELSLRTNWK